MKNVLLTVLMTIGAITGLQAQTTNTTAPPSGQPAAVKTTTTTVHHTAKAISAAAADKGNAGATAKTTTHEKLKHGHEAGIINAGKVPAKIKSTFADDVNKPTNVKWTKHDSLYEVWFTDWGMQKFRVYFTDTVSTVSEMAVKQLPKTLPDNIKQFVNSNYKDNAPLVFYKGYAFRTDANVAKNLDKQFLRVDTGEHSLYFDTDGKFVKEAYVSAAAGKPAL